MNSKPCAQVLRENTIARKAHLVYATSLYYFSIASGKLNKVTWILLIMPSHQPTCP